MGEGVSVTGAMPVPESGNDCGLVVALSVMESVAVRLPSAVGLKTTVMVQVFPEPSVLGVNGQVVVKLKSPGAVPPPIVMLLIVSATVCVFLNVVLLPALATPAAWLPNAKLVGTKVVCAEAIEESAKKMTSSGSAPNACRNRVQPVVNVELQLWCTNTPRPLCNPAPQKLSPSELAAFPTRSDWAPRQSGMGT